MEIANEPNSRPSDQEILLETIISFIQAKTWEEQKSIIEAHPELLGNEANSLMVQIVQTAMEQEDESIRSVIDFHHFILRRCREVGVELTFAEPDAQVSAFLFLSKFQDDLKLIEKSVQNYQLIIDPTALDDAIGAWERILNHPDFSRSDQSFIHVARNRAGRVYEHRYLARGDIPDLRRAIDLLQQAVAAIPKDHSDLPIYLNDLGCGLSNLRERLGRIEDLERAIMAYRQAVAATPKGHSDLPMYLSNLGDSLRILYERQGRIEDLQEAISVCRQAVAATTEDHPNLPIYLNNLGLSLRDLYERLDRIEYLEEAIRVYRQAVKATPEKHPNLPKLFSNLGTGLRILYERQGRIEDLEEAISVCRKAVAATPEGHPNLPMYLSNLGNSLRILYQRQGRIEDLEEAISVCRKAVKATPEDYPDLPLYLNDLGIGLHIFYECLGRIEDLEEAIRIYRRAVKATPEGHLDLPDRLNSLGIGIRDHYERLGRIMDLEEAIKISRKAVAATPEGHSDLAMYLNNLGNSLFYLYERLDRIEDLEEAIGVYRQAVAATPEGHTGLPLYLNNLGICLGYLYERLNHVEDLEEAIRVYRQAVTATPEGHTGLPLYLSNLANGLHILYQRLGRIIDLEEAIKICRKAMEATPKDHPDLPGRLNNLGNYLRDHYERLGLTKDMEESISSYRRSCDLGIRLALNETVKASRNWQRWAFERGSWIEVVEAYEFIQRWTERRLSSQFSRSDKSFSLGGVQGLTAQVAYAHFKLDQLREAVEVLEHGQAQLLREALERKRRDLERLKELGFNQLYEQFMQATRRYESLLSLTHSENRPSDWLEQVQRALQEMDYSSEAIRNDAGKENPEYRFFLRSLPFEEIQKQANEVPLIYLAATSSGGMALVVNGISLEVIELPELSDITLRKNVLGLNDAPQLGGYLGAYEKWRNNNRDLSALAAWLMALKETTRWLWDKIMGKVLAHLEAKGIREAVLIPTGLLGLLPLHAAWTEDLSRLTGRRYALDDFTLTYAPSAHALYHARQGANRRADNLLAVENPDGTLRFAKDEVKAVLSHFPGKNNHLMRDQAIKKDVVKAIDVSQVLHFSTHGLAGWQEAESSCLKLADGNLTLGEFFGLRLDQARMAVLSACETGVIGMKLPDEVVSLPSALMQAGVPGVIGSLWSVDEMTTAMLMAQFYDLWRDSHLSPPEALRQAQIWLRDSTVEELKRQFKGSMESQGSRLSVEAAESFYKKIGLKDSKARLFDHPFYWASFEYTGL